VRPLALSLAGLVALAGIVGCSPRASRVADLAVPLPLAFAEAAAAPAEPARWEGERWWEGFGDPALTGLLEEAFRGNLALERAYARLDQLVAAARSSGAARRPSVDLRAQASRDHQPGLRSDADTRDARLSAAAAYEVDLWGRLASREQAAGWETGASQEDLRALYLSLSAQVADLHYLILEQASQLILTDGAVEAYQSSLGLVERRYRAGLVPSLDVYQARQALAGARTRRPVQEASLARAQHGLAVLLGQAPAAAAEGGAAELPAAPALAEAGVPADLLRRRPDLRAAFARLEAADARAAAAVADRFPAVNLGANLGAVRTVLEAGTVTGIFWNLLAGLAQPVLDGGRRAAEVDRTEAVVRESAVVYRQAVLEALREVEDALSDNRTTEARISRGEERVGASGATLRAATDRYLQGLSDYLPVLSAQAALLDAQGQLLSARRQLLSDRLSLVRALGGDWMDGWIREKRETGDGRTTRGPQPTTSNEQLATCNVQIGPTQ